MRSVELRATLEILPLVKAFGTMFGTYGLWRLASRVKNAKGLQRTAAWAWFSAGVALAVALFSIVVYQGEPAVGPAVVSSLAVHGPWVMFLLALVLAKDHGDQDHDREFPC
jgi:fatty acid desaturase